MKSLLIRSRDGLLEEKRYRRVVLAWSSKHEVLDNLQLQDWRIIAMVALRRASTPTHRSVIVLRTLYVPAQC